MGNPDAKTISVRITQQRDAIYSFERFEVDVVKRVLRRDGVTIHLTPRVFEILLLLVRNPGRVIEKREIMQAIWSGSFVEESNITQNIFVLRKALGDSADGRRLIVTIPGRGYNFTPEVRKVFRTVNHARALPFQQILRSWRWSDLVALVSIVISGGSLFSYWTHHM